MTFHSILFKNMADRMIPEDQARDPDFFGDLNFHQIVAAVTGGKEEYNLKPFFSMPLHDGDAVAYRHEVMRDLEDTSCLEAVKAFAVGMHAVRDYLSQIDKRYYERQKDRWFLDAVELYGKTINRFARELPSAPVRSRGLSAFCDWLSGYAKSAQFTSLVEESTRIKTELSAIRYCILMQGPHVEVQPFAGEPDYSADVQTTFERFQQGDVQNYKFTFSDTLEMNHVEAQILDGVAYLHPAIFSSLGAFRQSNQDFLDPTVVDFDREIQFYVAYLEYISALKQAGLAFCYPRVSASSKDVHDCDGFDLALAGKLLRENTTPICNDFFLRGQERILVVSGPNQGGKTTFARTFGQIHYLASLGCLVPGTHAHLFLPDRIFTHFEREEQMTNLRGKLEDDLVRIHGILEAATPRDIVIINEIFSSTALRDAVFLSKKIAARLIALDVLCLWVTFIDEVASLSEQTVSMVSTVVPENPAQRTFKIVRRAADGLAYAMSIAEKYRLTYEIIKQRIRP